MQYSGVLQGLSHRYDAPVLYSIQFKEDQVELNSIIGNQIQLQHKGVIECVACGRKIKKTYNSGYCYPCFIGLAENDLCIVKPNECHFHLGTCRDAAFGERHCMIPHYVYLAQSSDIKVGLTRKNNEVRRWIDQGAVQAIPIAELPTRKLAGELEYAISQNLPDKTNWRKMLKGELDEVDLMATREYVFSLFPEEFQQYKLMQSEITEIRYPVSESITKITSFNLDKEPIIEGKLIGIKGQYLLLENGVINMRKHSGYHIHINVI